MEPDKLSALLKGQLTQQDYLSSQNEIVANPILTTLEEAPELETKPEVSAATPESGSEFDPESENESEESSAESYDEEGEEEEDDDDESEGGSDEDEDDEDEESEADNSSKSGADDGSKSSEIFKADVTVKADVGLKVENEADEEVDDGLKEKLETNGGKLELPPANGDVSVVEQMDFKDDLDVKDEGALIAGEIVPAGKTFESDPDLMSAISDPKFGEELGISNGSDSNLKASDGTLADGEQPKSEAGGKSKTKEKSTKPKRKRKRAAEGGEKSEKKKKRRKKEDGDKKKKKGKSSKKCHERKNIRKIFKEGDLDENTITAQQEEKERKERLAALQRNVASNMHLKALLETDDSEDEEEAKEDIIVLDKGDQAKRTGKYAAFKPSRDVIELSSDDEDDDVTVLETPVEEIEIEDPNNSGLHVDDTLNIPDEQGRVLVNVGHPGDEPDIFLAPQIAKVIKPHQIGGIRFLYDNLVESVNRFKTSHGFGCILAHSMGLGKTIQMVSFIDIFLRNTDAKSVLVIVPINTLQNWLNEFSMWTPEVPNPDESMKDQIWPREFCVHLINDNHKTTKARAAVIQTWMKKGGVLLMGYEMYRLLATRKATKAKRKPGKKSGNPLVIDLEEEDRNQELAMDIQTALLRPGPDLVICDEGHRIKNSHASISQALKNIRTRRRVVLTGYPLQNNLVEYWCMVDFVRPNYLGNKAEFCNMFERPIMNGQCVDSTPNDARLMRHRAHVLHSLLEGFVQRRGHAVLKDALPTKVEHVLFVRMSPVQRKLYRLFMDSLTEMALSGWATVNPLKAFSVCCKIWNHPDILYNIVKQMRSDAIEDDLDLGETADGKPGEDGVTPIVKKPRGRKKKTPAQPTPVIDPATGRPFPDMGSLFPDRRMETITYEWSDDVIKTYTPGDLSNGGKMVVLFNIIEETIRSGEKLLVFSQSLFTLNLMEEFLGQRKVPNSEDKWAKNKHYFRLDGSTSSQEREKLINSFNAPNNENVHLFLLSTRAGCLGINLVGASRVVVFDASWNPCHDCQAVCRVYRYGQTKPCYIYRLVTDNTLEKKIYERQINKQGMADRVVDEMNPQNNFTKRQVESLLHYEDQDLPVINIEFLENLTDPVMRMVLKDYSIWLTKDPFTHESLLIDQQDLRLTKAEKKLARQSYEREKKMSVSSYQRPSYQAYYPKPGEIAGASNSYISGLPRTLSLATSLPNPGSLAPTQSMATPVPMTLKKDTSVFGGKGFDLGMNHTGVTVNQVITTTEIVVPATNTSTDATPQIKIPPGKQILVIKTQKGVYIRTPEGKIFAVRGGGGGARTATATKPVGTEVTTVTGTTSTPTVSTANSNNNADSMTGFESRSSGSPRVPSSVLDLMDGSSQDSMSSATTSGMPGLLRSALMKGRQEAASRPPGPSVQPPVAPSPLTAQFSSLSTSSHHASPVPFTQGATLSRQSSHQASPVPFTQGHSRFGASPMESLVSMATSKPQKHPTSEEGESVGQESEQNMSGTKFGSVNVPGYNSMAIDYQPPTYPGSSHRLPTTTTNSFVEPKLSSQLSGTAKPKKLVDPYKLQPSGRKQETGHSITDLLKTNCPSSPDDTMNDLLKPSYDENMEDYDSGDSSGMSGFLQDIDFDTPMPRVEQALPASTPGPLGISTKQTQGSRPPGPLQIQRQMCVQYFAGRGRGMTKSNVSSTLNRNEEAGMTSLRAVRSDQGSGAMNMEESGPPLSIADYQRAMTTATKTSAPKGRGESKMPLLGSRHAEQGADSMEESGGPPLSIVDYQRLLSRSGSNSGTTQAVAGGPKRQDVDRMSSLGSLLGGRRPGVEKMDEAGRHLGVSDYQQLLTQTDKGSKYYSGGDLIRKQDSGMSASDYLHGSQSPGSESMEDSGSPLSITDYQRLLNRAADSTGNKRNIDPNRKQEYSMSSLGSLQESPSPGSESMDDSGPPLSIVDYQRLISQTANSSGPKANMALNRKQESVIPPLRSRQETPSPGSESMEDSGPPLSIADYQRLISQTANSSGAKADVGKDSNRKPDYGMPPVSSLQVSQSPESESMEDSGSPLSIADYQRLIDRTATDKGTKPNIGRDPIRKQEFGIPPLSSVQKTRSPGSERREDSGMAGPPLGIADYQQHLNRTADNAGTKPNTGGPPNRSRDPGMSSLGSLLGSQSPESESMEDSGPPLSITDYQRLLTKTAETTGAKGTDSNRTQKPVMSSLGLDPGNPSPGSESMEDSGPPLSIADYQRLLDQTEASARPTVSRESEKSSQMRNPGTGAGNMGMENFGPASSGANYHWSISHPATGLATDPKINTNQNRIDGKMRPSVVDPNPASESLEDSGPPLGILDYQRALSRTSDTNPMNRTGDEFNININLRPPAPVHDTNPMNRTGDEFNINLRPPAPVQAANATSKKKGKANPPLGAPATKTGKKRGPKPGSTRKKATKKTPDLSQPAFGGQMGLQGNQQGPAMSHASMNMGMRHPFMGNHPGLSRSLSDSGQVGTNYGRGGPRPVGRDQGSSGMSFGYEGSRGQTNQENFGERMNMPAVSHSPSLDRMFDSDSSNGQDQRQSLMMDYLGKRAANSPLNQDGRGPSLGSGSSHLGMTRGNLDTNMPSSMDMDMSRNYSNPQKQENFDLIQQLYQTDSLSKSSDLFPGEDTMQPNELVDFLTKGNIVSSSATHRPLSELSGLYSSPNTATTCSSMSMSSSGVQDSSGRISSMLGQDSRNRLPGMVTDSSGRMSGYMGGESGNRLQDSSGRITGSGSGGNGGGLGYGVSVKQEDSSGRLTGMGDSSGRLTGMGDSSGRLTGMGDSSSRLPGMGESSGRLTGMGDSSGRLTGMGDSSGRLTGMGDSSGRLTGMGDSSGRLPGMGESSGRLTGMGDSSGRLTGMGDSSGRLPGMGESSGRLTGMGGSSDRLPGMGNFSHGFGNTGMMNNYGDMSGSSGDGMSGLGDSNNPYAGMGDTNNLTGYQDSNNRLGMGEANTRHSGLNDAYSQSQSDFGASQSYLDQMTARSTGQEYATMSSQPQSSQGTLPSFNSSYMQSASEMNMSHSWMGSTMGYTDSYGVQNTDVYGMTQGAPHQENMSWSNYSHYPNQATQGNPSQSLMSGSMEKNT